MGLIEQAAKRLEELRRAGVEVPAERAEAPPRPHAVPAAGRAEEGRLDGPHAEIDLARLAAEGFVTPDQPRSRVAEEFRILKRPLLANASPPKAPRVKHGNLIMVTSAVPDEGKTFCSVNLAMSIALELDRTVLLVDADIAKPMLPKTLGIAAGRGLLDLLSNPQLDPGVVLAQTNVAKLAFMPSGTPHPRPAELLASDAMTRLLDQLSGRYPDRVVVFDCPPLLATTEARLLASRAGQLVLVVHAESTLQSQVKHALATIEACPVKMLVLNGARSSGQTYGYGYGYGYGG